MERKTAKVLALLQEQQDWRKVQLAVVDEVLLYTEHTSR